LKKYKYVAGTDVRVFYTSAGVSGLLNGTYDVITALTHTELAQLLQSVNPATNQLYSIDDLSIIDLNTEGTAMLEDGVFVAANFVDDSLNQNGLTRFLRASLKVMRIIFFAYH
jgi:NitT/TauT family transport system substrate-binding protein